MAKKTPATPAEASVLAAVPDAPESSEAAPAPKAAKFKHYRSKHDGAVYPALKFPVGYEDAHPEEFEGVKPTKKDE